MDPLPHISPPPEEGVVASVPPPPPEVSIRTMESDLRSIAATGGSRPEYQRIPLRMTEPLLRHSGPSFTSRIHFSNIERRIIVVIVSIIALGVLAVLGYLLYVFINSRLTGNTPPPAAQTEPPPLLGTQGTNAGNVSPPSTPPPQNSTPSPPPVLAPFDHHSFLKQSPDETLAYVFGAPATSASDLGSYSQKITGLVSRSTVTAVPAFFEVAAQNVDGKALSFAAFLGQIGAPVLDPNLLLSDFNPDFTFYIYRDKNGLWPGYVLELRPQKSWVYVKSDFASIERAKEADLISLFITSPGVPVGSFKDGTAAGTPARVLTFQKGELMYVQVGNHIILGTSEAGLKAVLPRL